MLQINLSAYVCSAGEGGGGGGAGAEALAALEARGLDALVPQLRVQAQLQRQLAAEPAPHALYRWIKVSDRLDPAAIDISSRGILEVKKISSRFSVL